MTDSHLVDEVVRAFENADRNPDREQEITRAAWDLVEQHRIWSDANRIWSRACHAYDQIHMDPDDYEKNYGGDE